MNRPNDYDPAEPAPILTILTFAALFVLAAVLLHQLQSIADLIDP